ncbi:MAG: flagellar motor protein MotB, partial [Maribacter sp.]
MKKIFFYSIVLMANIMFGQINYSSAERNFNSLWYKKAAQQYQAQVEKGDDSQEALQKVGDAYYFNTDMQNAVKWYGQLFAKYEHALDPTYIFRYIHTLKGVGNYGMAKLLTTRYGA